MAQFSIQIFNKKELPEFQDYIRQAFHEKYILVDQRYIDWQYGGRIYVAKDGARIIGHFGFRDLPYKFYKESGMMRILMNLMVLEPYRLLGVGALLAKEVFNTKNKILVSGYTPAAQKLFSHLRSDWKEAGNLSRFIAIFNPSATLFSGYKIPVIFDPQISRNMFDVCEAEDIAKDFEDFWKNVRERYPIAAERTLDYLNWRFINHPFFKYSILTARHKNNLAGYLIFRFEEDQGFKIARIIDFVSEEAAEKSLIGKFLELAKNKKAAAADFAYSGNCYRQSLLDSGFFETAGTDFEKFPILFSPISTKKTFINIACDFNCSLGDCFFTKADGDQDRPNL